ncbi:MAG: O-antigen ligase domain-containing protein, partial [Thermomicrobium sp.]
MRDSVGEHRFPVWPHTTMYGLSPGLTSVVGAAVALLGAVTLATLAVRFGPIPATAALSAVVVAAVIAFDVRAGLWVVVAVAALLPYAVIPVKVVITPPILELTGLSVLGVWLLQLFLRRDVVIPPHPVLLGLTVFLAVTLFAFVLGIGRGYTTQTYHDYTKFLVSLSLFFVAWSSLRTLHDFRRMTVVFLGVTGTAALLGLALYAGGPAFTLTLLARLVPYGYPASRIVRFIEDDPAKPMRLTSTSVDPNSFAGLLALAFVVGVAQFVARRPVVPRWLALGASVVIGLALLLTYSRAGWLGAAFGVAV